MKFFTIFFIYFSLASFAQVIYVDAGEDVYRYLDRLSLKHIIKLNDEIHHKTRHEIVMLLAEISEKKEELNPLETEELEWHLREYGSDIYKGTSTKDRWYLYSYKDSLFHFTVSPIAGYGLTSFGGESGHIKLIGAKFWGTHSDWFGASFEYSDKGEFGRNIDRDKLFTRSTAHYYKHAPNGIEYSDVKGSLNFNWSWGSVSLRKDYNIWGHGSFGQLFISDKSGSYPHILLNLQPVPWFRFSYFHGWLNSLIPDSLAYYYNHAQSETPVLRRKFVDKFVAANMLTVTPWKWLDFSIGNSFVYSGNLRPEIFLPFIYFKVMDHNLGREGFDDGNGQIFADAKFSYIKNFSFYSSLLIDVIEVREILKGKWYTSWFGYTVGGKYIDLFLPNLTVSAEYTKTNPWIYENSDESTDYKHRGYTLGHWIGQNADLFSLQLDYRFIRGLNISLLTESFRKGGLRDIIFAYQKLTELPFLYSPVRIENSIEINVVYEPIHDLKASGYFRYTEISDEDASRTPGWQAGSNNSFGLVLTYGL